VETYCPKFDVVYTHNPLVRTLFEQAGHELGIHEVFERARYWGTTIRDKMLNGGEWRDCIPKSVAEYIDEVDGVRRLKRLSGSDEPEQ
jgi:nicotinamide-nucleotide adenylyltransferase